MIEQTKIIIADDHPIFRGGLRQIIEGERSFTVVGEASDGETALRLVRELEPDVAILDLNMPEFGGFAVISEIRRRNLPCQIIVLTMHDEEAIFAKAMSLGVGGYVLKDGAAADIVNCLHAVCRGQSYTSAAVTSYLFKRAAGNARPVKGIGALRRPNEPFCGSSRNTKRAARLPSSSASAIARSKIIATTSPPNWMFPAVTR